MAKKKQIEKKEEDDYGRLAFRLLPKEKEDIEKLLHDAHIFVNKDKTLYKIKKGELLASIIEDVLQQIIDGKYKFKRRR